MKKWICGNINGKACGLKKKIKKNPRNNSSHHLFPK